RDRPVRRVGHARVQAGGTGRPTRALGQRARVRPARARDGYDRDPRRAGRPRDHPGRHGAQSRHAGRGGGAQPPAAVAWTTRRAAAGLAARTPARGPGRSWPGYRSGGRMTAARESTRAAAPGPTAAAFVVVTGLSGAGKSHAIRALEDLGYFCVDNLPLALLPMFADRMLNEPATARPAAVVIDVREGRALSRFPSVYRRLQRDSGGRVRLLFLEASDSVLMRRFSETRRPHPLAAGKSVAEGLAEERRLLVPMRKLADRVLDTSTLTVHELRRRIREVIDASAAVAPLVVTLMSFGFRRGVPLDADVMFDVRFLP